MLYVKNMQNMQNNIGNYFGELFGYFNDNFHYIKLKKYRKPTNIGNRQNGKSSRLVRQRNWLFKPNY